jgi:hypothetical protein
LSSAAAIVFRYRESITCSALSADIRAPQDYARDERSICSGAEAPMSTSDDAFAGITLKQTDLSSRSICPVHPKGECARQHQGQGETP